MSATPTNTGAGRLAALPDRETITVELTQFSAGLDAISRDAVAVTRELEEPERTYALEREAFVAELWRQYGAGEIRAWPGEDVRRDLFHRHLRETEGGIALLARLGPLRARRKRLLDRLEDVRSGVSARQTILRELGGGG